MESDDKLDEALAIFTDHSTSKAEREAQQQQLMEPRVGVSSTAAKLRGWQQTLDLLECGELSNSEVWTILQQSLPLALEECIQATLEDDAELKEQRRMLRVLGRVQKALEQYMRTHGLLPRTRCF